MNAFEKFRNLAKHMLFFQTLSKLTKIVSSVGSKFAEICSMHLKIASLGSFSSKIHLFVESESDILKKIKISNQRIH